MAEEGNIEKSDFEILAADGQDLTDEERDRQQELFDALQIMNLRREVDMDRALLRSKRLTDHDEYQRVFDRCSRRKAELRELLDSCKPYEASNLTVKNAGQKTADVSLYVYRSILSITKDVFGDKSGDLPDDVMCKAIEAASYGMWRTIMGPSKGSPAGTVVTNNIEPS